MVGSLKRAGSGPIQSPVSNPLRGKTNQKRTNKPKTNNQTKNQPKKTEKGLQPAVGIPCMMTSYVSSKEWPKIKHNTEPNKNKPKGHIG